MVLFFLIMSLIFYWYVLVNNNMLIRKLQKQCAYVSCQWHWMRDECQSLEPAGDAETQYTRPVGLRPLLQPRLHRALRRHYRTTGWYYGATPDRRTVRRRRDQAPRGRGEVRRPSVYRHWGCAGHGWLTIPSQSTTKLTIIMRHYPGDLR